MATFNPGSAWTPDRDVRDWADWISDLNNAPPNGQFWALVAPRRSGKTWMLSALARELNGSFIRLDSDGTEPWESDYGVGFLFVDEPGELWTKSGSG